MQASINSSSISINRIIEISRSVFFLCMTTSRVFFFFFLSFFFSKIFFFFFNPWSDSLGIHRYKIWASILCTYLRYYSAYPTIPRELGEDCRVLLWWTTGVTGSSVGNCEFEYSDTSVLRLYTRYTPSKRTKSTTDWWHVEDLGYFGWLIYICR